MSRLPARERWALAALGTILAITAAWWALALWPLPAEAAPWLVRTRAVCFGAVVNGLPTTAGWMVLIGQPLYMLATLWLIAGGALGTGVRSLARSAGGRGLLRGATIAVVVGLAAAGVRVAQAAAGATLPAATPGLAAADVPRLDEPAPALALRDQHGSIVSLARFRGRPVFVTFAFAHCTTVCPVIVHDLERARRAVQELEPVTLIVTVDPWRDTPERLPSIAQQWKLEAGGYVLSGSVAEVEATLDRWRIARTRDRRTGAVTHPAHVYVVDREGRIAFSVLGADAAALAELARRL